MMVTHLRFERRGILGLCNEEICWGSKKWSKNKAIRTDPGKANDLQKMRRVLNPSVWLGLWFEEGYGRPVFQYERRQRLKFALHNTKKGIRHSEMT